MTMTRPDRRTRARPRAAPAVGDRLASEIEGMADRGAGDCLDLGGVNDPRPLVCLGRGALVVGVVIVAFGAFAVGGARGRAHPCRLGLELGHHLLDLEPGAPDT